ncbi:MAG: hypothetical protein LBH88_00080 [Candidatus Methanoplasma sp.]|jgi:polyphosphate kinase 2 (PPK2 family)|nr:hypothetical protein [Candidatus Methanoplasma sp.]
MHALIPGHLVSKLNQLQQEIFVRGLPVVIIFEGSSGRVIGRVNNELIRCLEPRGVIYRHFDPAEHHDSRLMLESFRDLPRKGQIGLCDRSWYSSIIERCAEDGNSEEIDRLLGMSNDFERYLVLNGVLVIKVILRASAEAVEEFGPQYGPGGQKVSFLSMDHIDPVKYREVMFDRVYDSTNTAYAPWDIVMVRNIRETVLETAETIMERIESRLGSEPHAPSFPDIKRKYANPRKETAMDPECAPYEERMDELSERLGELQMALSLSDRSMVVCFEGWDASGKGSCIKHLCHALNPRGYEVFQTKAPTDEELMHTYLWRFARGIPEKGRITIFDRTWYGRMMVEHIEGFCTEEEYRRSPFEINTFEKMLLNGGTILLKFWLDITPDEQKKRFQKRTDDPLKQWKITDEDWRNRSKWKEYDAHVDVMMESTNTEGAPWTVIQANSKKYARIKVLKTVVEALERELNN